VRRISPPDFLFCLARSVPSEYASSRGISDASILDITRMPGRGESETYLGARNMRAVSSHSAKYILPKFRIYHRHSCRHFPRAKRYRVQRGEILPDSRRSSTVTRALYHLIIRMIALPSDSDALGKFERSETFDKARYSPLFMRYSIARVISNVRDYFDSRKYYLASPIVDSLHPVHSQTSHYPRKQVQQ
jgi:hypothetical protein